MPSYSSLVSNDPFLPTQSSSHRSGHGHHGHHGHHGQDPERKKRSSSKSSRSLKGEDKKRSKKDKDKDKEDKAYRDAIRAREAELAEEEELEYELVRDHKLGGDGATPYRLVSKESIRNGNVRIERDGKGGYFEHNMDPPVPRSRGSVPCRWEENEEGFMYDASINDD